MNTAMLNKIQFDQIREQVAHYVLGNHTKERLDATLPSSNLATVSNWQQETKEARFILDSGQHVPSWGLRGSMRFSKKIAKGLILTPNELSTFSAHVAQIATILRHTGRNTLILLDELGSGTEPGEGAALAIAVMESLYRMGGLIVATTHYAEIKNFAERHADFIPAAMAFDNETLTPKYQLQLGQVGASQALWIARKMQITPAVVQRAAHYINHADYQLDKIEFKNITQKKVH
ncbi:MutS-related protein [Amylolactobacillus amylophilus]|uniref:MutS-related protein n=1 Tax=Amylolactobacillus amylophilus TaxID=1603 RepID=UPI0006D1D59C|nr:hypothetical protein [Amylolactobacillus amylophilus]